MSFLESTFDRAFSPAKNLKLLEQLELRFLLLEASETDPARKFGYGAQVDALYKKNLSLDSDPVAREARAFEKWTDAEEQCRQTNRRFKSLASGGFPERGALIFRVQRKIAKILGPAPSLEDISPSFGPGANVGCKTNTNSRSKLASILTASANVSHLVSHVAATHPWWQMENFSVTQGELAFVPKTAQIDRSIVVEPILNTYLQKGAGGWIRRRLKRAGCDLSSQETNRDLARLASITGFLATVDLSSASDTLASAVVEEVLPYDWWALLHDLSTRSVTYAGRSFTLQKFSSMGNGFTFELESLIFFAIAKSVCEDSQFVSVYGDDIIVPTRSYLSLVDALTFFGFSVNMEKSFSEGPFRESCGKDYYFGIDTRPVYVKEGLSVRQLFRLHNFFKRNYDEETAALVLSFIPSGFRVYCGPDGYGDGHLIGDWTPIRRGRKHGWSLKGFRSFAAEQVVRKRSRGMYPAILYLNSLHAAPEVPVVDPEFGVCEWRAELRRYKAGFSSDFIDRHGLAGSAPISDALFTERGVKGWKARTVYVL